MSKKNKKPKSKTTLWYVGYRRYEVCVSAQPLPECRRVHRIRTISANAAGRKYRSEILPSINWKIDVEYDNPYSCVSDDIDSKEFQRQIKKEKKKNIKHFTIKVIK